MRSERLGPSLEYAWLCHVATPASPVPQVNSPPRDEILKYTKTFAPKHIMKPFPLQQPLSDKKNLWTVVSPEFPEPADLMNLFMGWFSDVNSQWLKAV